MSTLSIILPVLDEAPRIAAALAALAALRPGPEGDAGRAAETPAITAIEVFVVDGGSADDTVAQAIAAGATVLGARRGRAAQMNAGARAARGEVLLFLHADTTLPANACDEIARGLAAGHDWGRFDVAITGTSAWFPVIAAMMNLRSRRTAIATGDQGIFVRRETFTAVGGFPDLPLMEDIALCRLLRRHGAPYASRARVLTSGRRWEKHGVWRTITLMWRLRLAYFFGADPARLALAYGYDAPVGIAILAKAPIPGYAKTRLAPLLGDDGAARLQAWLLRRSVRAALAARLGPVVLWGAPDATHPALRACAALGPLCLRAQPDGDLGARMLAAAARSAGTIGTLVIGTDCPALDASVLRAAASALRHYDVVLVPAEDGGYALIGLRTPAAAVFSGIEWGRPTVLDATRRQLRAAGRSWIELPGLWDVDRPEDYARLVAAFPDAALDAGAEIDARVAIGGRNCG